tara:strand:+ start:426 stop:1388 length:963 start_codon:yes stop_codon:yes gene_type:complete
MAQPTNTFDTYDSVNAMREDLADVIYNISPTETPFMSNASKGSATNTLHQWNTDSLSAVAVNAKIEGDEVSGDAITDVSRLTNYTQISLKSATISGTDDAVENAGMGEQMAYQMAKMGKELKRDMENAMIGIEQAKVAGDASTARKSASVGTWYGPASPTNNYSKNGSPSAVPLGTGATAIAGGTNRTYTEDLLKAGLKVAFDNGGNPDTVLMTASHKQLASAFNGVATKYKDASDKVSIGTTDIYVSDFGEVAFVPDRFQNANRVDILQMDMWSVDFLRPFQSSDLSKTGDSNKKMILAEWTLTAKAPNANYGIFNLTA